MKEWKNGQMTEEGENQTDEKMNKGQMKRQKNGQMKEWKNGQRSGQMKRQKMDR